MQHHTTTGTANMMQWAAEYSKTRGYAYWRAFTTGKPPSLGGIPHDTYGMTTRSVHRYVLGCLRKLKLEESETTKIQTGGPDGDLGCNEILISKDKTIGIADGAGVIYDPAGLDRTELTRLAKARVMVNKFDDSKLGPGGFKVLVSDNDVTLPNGEVVDSGVKFRDGFHLSDYATADLFVPCGGRPESVNLTNVHRMFKEDGKTPKFRIIVEGANLFFTNDARMVLENAGVLLFKDASTNKGGVTSSSKEVLGALALDDATFAKHLAVPDIANPPAFYKEYAQEIVDTVETLADLEFECLWRERERSGEHSYVLTETVSAKINALNDFIQKSDTLWDNVPLRKAVMAKAFPQSLQRLVGLDSLLERTPESYTRAIFACYLASQYVYAHGLASNEFSFFEFMQT
jgi:glutamate dehydrogenase